jgi:uncharacterized membrane protein YozB (DUF420 family)
MESRLINKEPGLLPGAFKIIGIVVVVVALTAMIVGKTATPQFVQAHKEVFKMAILNALILGLFFIGWAKDKIEDEMTRMLRMRAMAASFGSGVIYVFVYPLLDIIGGDSVQPIPAQQVVMFMLITYLITYAIQKATR